MSGVRGVARSQYGYGMDNFYSGVSLKVLPTLARLTRQDGDILLRTEAISTLGGWIVVGYR